MDGCEEGGRGRGLGSGLGGCEGKGREEKGGKRGVLGGKSVVTRLL